MPKRTGRCDDVTTARHLSKLSTSLVFLALALPSQAVLAQTSSEQPTVAGGAVMAYRLGPQDQLDLRVADFTSSDELRAWTALNGVYTVAMDGSLAVPFAGSVPAAGRTTQEVSEAVARRIGDTLGLPTRPAVSVAVAQYRPFFVVGAVETPGAYPFQPGLTVAKALALAGGLSRGVRGSGAGRNLINARGDLALFEAERNRLAAARARIEAEIAGREAVVAPAAADGSNMQSLVAGENSFMQTRRDRLKRQLDANEDLQALLAAEIEALSAQRSATQGTSKLAAAELRDLQGLKSKGLARTDRVRQARQTVVDAEGELLDIQTASLRARQALNRAQNDATALVAEQAATLAAEKQEIDGKIEALALRERTRRLLVDEALVEGASAIASAAEQERYRVTRTDRDGAARSRDVDRNAPLLPGDVFEVVLGSEAGL